MTNQGGFVCEECREERDCEDRVLTQDGQTLCETCAFYKENAAETVYLNDFGEIEVVDEHSGEVIGHTADDSCYFEASEMTLREASKGELDHLFGVKSPYGDDFGSF